MGITKDITGQKFNRLTAIRKVGINKHGSVLWLFKCDCGKETTTIGANVIKNLVKSCGCLAGIINGQRQYKHGLSKERPYDIFIGLRARCRNTNHRDYFKYGARGIKCEWNTFNEFWNDMGESYKEMSKRLGEKNISIDRINNDGNYCKENCRWATLFQQSRNTRRNKMITHRGKTQCLRDWSTELNIKYVTLSSRLKRGWDIEKAFK